MFLHAQRLSVSGRSFELPRRAPAQHSKAGSVPARLTAAGAGRTDGRAERRLPGCAGRLTSTDTAFARLAALSKTKSNLSLDFNRKITIKGTRLT